MRRFSLAAISVSLLIILGVPGTSFAQKCDLENSLNAFLAVKDQGSGKTTVEPTEEFRLQKALLQKIIGCMGSETDAMEATLRDLGEIPDELKDIRDEFVKTLDEYRGHFDAEARRLREIPELKDVKQFAKDLFEWREKTYRPALRQMLALSSIMHGKESLKTASVRIQKINAALRTLGLAGNRELRLLLDKAAKNLKDADALNSKALDRFLALARPAPEPEPASADATSTLPLAADANDAVSAAESGTVTSTSATSTDAVAPLPSPGEIAKESLLKIRDAYRLFVNVSDAVGRILQ